MMNIFRSTVFLTIIVSIGFVSPMKSAAQAGSRYDETIDAWRIKRLAELKAENGWLNLAGLYWLEPGKNTMGQSPKNDFVCELPNMPVTAGFFTLKKGKVYWNSAGGVEVKMLDKPVKKAIIFENGRPVPVLNMGSFRWNIIRRDDKLGVRLRDLNHPGMKAFDKLPYFPTDTTWRLDAKFVAGNNDSVMISNMIGQTHAQHSPGKLYFKVGDKEYSLDALESGKEDLFIIFADHTNGNETYASGRYLYVPKADADGMIELDFNKAINPPCVFTPFATCPIPPRQNRLPFAVSAGEKMIEKK
ncbi:DUF1684 domain-containing protein [Pollutibacter soli]|uniref:DUF1684 domain-containing protein n=1 Tax=Pollutibacter soli TaxID=3034157 RepID=UPI003013EA13